MITAASTGDNRRVLIFAVPISMYFSASCRTIPAARAAHYLPYRRRILRHYSSADEGTSCRKNRPAVLRNLLAAGSDSPPRLLTPDEYTILQGTTPAKSKRQGPKGCGRHTVADSGNLRRALRTLASLPARRGQGVWRFEATGGEDRKYGSAARTSRNRTARPTPPCRRPESGKLPPRRAGSALSRSGPPGRQRHQGRRDRHCIPAAPVRKVRLRLVGRAASVMLELQRLPKRRTSRRGESHSPRLPFMWETCHEIRSPTRAVALVMRSRGR